MRASRAQPSLRLSISGSPFHQVAQPGMKGYVHQAEVKVHDKPVWLDR